MLTLRDIHELYSFRLEGPDVLSLYLELEAGASPRKAFSALLENARTGWPDPTAHQRDLERIEETLAGFDPSGHRGAAVFSALRHGLWVMTPLPEPVKPLLRRGETPCLKPLLNLIDQYRRFGVLLADPQRARLMEVYLGTVVELELPPPSTEAVGSWWRLPALERHLKATADAACDLARRRGFDRLVVAAPREIEAELLAHLPSRLQENLILDPQLTTASPAERVLERILHGERESRKVRESVLVHRLLDAVRGGGLGIIGLNETIQALQRGQARLIMIRDGFAKIGRRCPSCGFLDLGGKRCRACYQPTEAVMNLVGELAAMAIDLNCEVVRLLNDTKLDSLGGIGAELKFKGREEPPATRPPEAPAREGASKNYR